MANLKIDIPVKMQVDRSTADICLKIVQLFVNNSGLTVVANRQENGELLFNFEELGPYE